MSERDPAEIIGKIGELPTLPEIYSRIAELTSDPDTGAKDLERVIENDQALASKLLKLVNSAFFGFPSEIRTISRAVMIVGFKADGRAVPRYDIVTSGSPRGPAMRFSLFPGGVELAGRGCGSAAGGGTSSERWTGAGAGGEN